MTSTVCDSSAVDNYLTELSNREAERTRRLTIENNKREIPFMIMKYLGVAIAIAIVVWVLGKSISNSNSYTQKIMGSSYGNPQISEHVNQLSEDQTLCVECLIEESQSANLPIIEETDKEIARNYVIFDNIKVQQGKISEVIVGRQYPDIDSETNSSWCYVNIQLDNGVKGKITFISNSEDGERYEIPIDQSLASNYGVTIEDLVAAKKECKI